MGGRVEVREADDRAVPAQELEEQPLPYLVGCLADRVQQLVHAAHGIGLLRHCLLVQVAASDESGDEVGNAVGFGVGEVVLLAGDEGAGGAEWFESVEDSGGGAEGCAIGDRGDGAVQGGGYRFELVPRDRRGVGVPASGGGDASAFPEDLRCFLLTSVKLSLKRVFRI